MNIIYATRAAVPYPSAASINTVQMCESLVALGHTVTLTVGRKFWRWSSSFVNISRFYGYAPSFQIRRVWELPRTGLLFDGTITELAERTDALVYLRYPRLLPLLANRRRPTILELHSAIKPATLRAIEMAFDAGSLLGIVVITQTLKQHLAATEELKPYADRIIVAPDAVHVARFPGTWCDQQPQSVGYVGGLYPGKGMERIVELAQSLPATEFVVYGGRARDRKFWASKTVACKNLSMPGRISPAEVPDRMASFGIALLPNQPSVRMPNGDDIGRFTSPIKLFEYMAAGKAIVASDLPNLREVLTHERNCLLVPPDDTAAWSAAVTRLQSDHALRHRIAKQAWEDARSRFSCEARFRTILQRLLPSYEHGMMQESLL